MNFTAVDVETTGTLSYADHIVELAAVRFVNGKAENKLSKLVNPGIPMPAEASRVNGITDEMLKDKPSISEVLDQFSEFCGTDFLVAHNAIFDYQFLRMAIEKHHCLPPQGIMLDTYTLSKKMFPGLSNYKLSTLAEHFKVVSRSFHRAEQDAWVCGQIFNIILKKLDESNPLTAVKKLIQITGKKVLRFPALNAKQLALFD